MIPARDLIRINLIVYNFIKKEKDIKIKLEGFDLNRELALKGLESLNLTLGRAEPLELTPVALAEESAFWKEYQKGIADAPDFEVDFYNEFGEPEGKKIPDRPCKKVYQGYQALPNLKPPNVIRTNL